MLNIPLQCRRYNEGHIDWKRRYINMQNHTGEHLLSGIMHSMYGYDNVSFHLNSEEGQVEYDGDIKDIDLIESESGNL